MQPKSAKLLEDIRDSAAFIQEAVAGKTLADYHADRPFFGTRCVHNGAHYCIIRPYD